MAFNVDKALKEGYTREEINAYLGKSGRTIESEKAKMRSKPARETRKPRTFAGNILEFLVPQTRETVQVGAGGLKARAGVKSLEERQSQLEKRTSDLVRQARQAPTEQEKQQLLTQARQLSQGFGQIGRQAERLEAGVGIEDEEKWSPVKQGAQTAAELGAWLAPAGAAGKGIPITKNLSVLAGKNLGAALARGGATSALSSILFNLSSDEKKTLKDMTYKTLASAFTGATISGAFYIGREGFKRLTTAFPRAMRSVGLDVDPEVAQKTLEQKAPKSYKKMKIWSKQMFDRADEQIQKLDADDTLTIIDAVGDDPEQLKWAHKTLTGLAKEFKKVGKKDKADELLELTNQLVRKTKKGKKVVYQVGQGLDFQDYNRARQLLDQSMKRAWKTAKRQGVSITDTGAMKQASRGNLANFMRDVLRNSPKVPEEAKKLFDSQHLALTVLGQTDKAMKKIRKKMLPSWWELAAFLGPVGAATMFGEEGLTSGLKTGLPILSVIALSRFLHKPQASKLLFEAGKLGEKLPEGRVLEEFLTKGAARAFNP